MKTPNLKNLDTSEEAYLFELLAGRLPQNNPWQPGGMLCSPSREPTYEEWATRLREKYGK